MHHHMCTGVEGAAEGSKEILLRKRSAISGREEETMSESDGESQDITSLIFYFFLSNASYFAITDYIYDYKNTHNPLKDSAKRQTQGGDQTFTN